MTVCNMTIEGGGRAGMVAPDDTTFAWVEGTARPPRRTSTRPSRAGASCTPRTARASTARSSSTPPRSRRRSPGARRPARSSPVTDAVPEPRRPRATERALKYMDLEPGTPIAGHPRSTACSSARARTRASATCAPPPRWSQAARSRPTSTRWSSRAPQQVKHQAEAEGLDEVFRAAGFDWRGAGLLDVPGHEPGHPAARRALRLDLEPQLRGAPGPRRPHAPRLAPDGRGRRHRGPLRRHPRLEP